jgi:hypothetical protein
MVQDDDGSLDVTYAKNLQGMRQDDAEGLLKKYPGLPDLYLVQLRRPFWLVVEAGVLTVSAAVQVFCPRKLETQVSA